MRWNVIILLFISFMVSFSQGFSQTEENQLYKRGQRFLQTGDYSNAILLFNRAVELSPEDIQSRQMLAYTYSLNRDFKNAEKQIKEVLSDDNVNEQSYQIAGNIYLGQSKIKQARKNYQEGLKKFPESGVLYSELGQVFYEQKDYTNALKSWIEGIRVEPAYSSNYYFAARAYYYSGEKFWALIYGEMFINMERFTNRTSEMKNILLNTYKEMLGKSLSVSLGGGPGKEKAEDGSSSERPDFKTAFLITLGSSADVSLNQGITPETLTMTRMQFLLRWGQFYKLVYPFALFDYQNLLAKKGLFEAYNQWLFGPPNNAALYKGWVQRNSKVMNELIQFLNSDSFHPEKDQFYQDFDKIQFIPAPLSQK